VLTFAHLRFTLRDFRKQFQKVLKKQGLIFKTSTKVISASKVDDKVQIQLESAKGGNEETVSGIFSKQDRR